MSFLSSECGASLVEYVMALVVVTLIGAAGALAIGGDAGGMSELASNAVDDARSGTESALDN